MAGVRILLSRRLRWAGDVVSLVGSAVRLVWAASPARCAATFGVQAVASLSLFFQVLLVDRALGVILDVGRSEGSMSDALVPVGLLALLTAATTAGLAAANLQYRILGEMVSRQVWRQILDVSHRVDLATYEDPKFHDHAARVQTNAAGQT